MTGYWVSLPYATYGVEVDDDGWVRDAAPIAAWMIGKRWNECRAWIGRKRGTIKTLGDN